MNKRSEPISTDYETTYDDGGWSSVDPRWKRNVRGIEIGRKGIEATTIVFGGGKGDPVRASRETNTDQLPGVRAQ